MGYGLEVQTVDGTDLSECLKVVGRTVELARAGRGPQMVVAELLRLCGHGEHDDAGYVDLKLKKSPVGRDCLKVAEEQLQRAGLADAAQLAAWRREVIHEIEETVARVQREPVPDPYEEKWHALHSNHLNELHDEV